ncbi:MAG: Response regulator PleD [Pelotomaculum sp. PtaB.Bin104]|nr:MAG: Response regulator PleD [Pelotomaculum sp. PtaB.Bin104]
MLAYLGGRPTHSVDSPASSGKMALRSVAVKLPDLILLDIKMPELDGYEVCRRLKADEQSKSIPVIFISALHDVSDKVKVLKVGGVDYITKPFQPEERSTPGMVQRS